jgi:hypothetical protein
MEEMYEIMKDEILFFKVNHDYWLIYTTTTTKQQHLVEYLRLQIVKNSIFVGINECMTYNK